MSKSISCGLLLGPAKPMTVLLSLNVRLRNETKGPNTKDLVRIRNDMKRILVTVDSDIHEYSAGSLGLLKSQCVSH